MAKALMILVALLVGCQTAQPIGCIEMIKKHTEQMVQEGRLIVENGNLPGGSPYGVFIKQGESDLLIETIIVNPSDLKVIEGQNPEKIERCIDPNSNTFYQSYRFKVKVEQAEPPRI